MKVLFTGASSFSGFWFVQALAKYGHEVVAVFQRQAHDYEGLRAHRVSALEGVCRREFACSFGTDRFFALVRGEEHWDVFCHHAANVHNYKSADFDINAALANNTRGIKEVLPLLKTHGCQKIAISGSVFEQSEGKGEDGDGLPAFSAYGVSKGLTAAVFRFYAQDANMSLGKFVIPNPFGPFEELRFTAYLIRCWRDGKAATVNTPDYVRDNIHVSLLAKAYAAFVAGLPSQAGFSAHHPSGYVETQGGFARRFAAEMEKTTGHSLSCGIKKTNRF